MTDKKENDIFFTVIKVGIFVIPYLFTFIVSKFLNENTWLFSFFITVFAPIACPYYLYQIYPQYSSSNIFVATALVSVSLSWIISIIMFIVFMIQDTINEIGIEGIFSKIFLFFYFIFVFAGMVFVIGNIYGVEKLRSSDDIPGWILVITFISTAIIGVLIANILRIIFEHFGFEKAIEWMGLDRLDPNEW